MKNNDKHFMVTIVKSVEFRVNMAIVTIVTNVTIVTFGTSGQNLTILTYVNIVTYVIIVTNVTVVTNVMILTCNNSDICDQS